MGNISDWPLAIYAQPSLDAPLVGWLPPEVGIRLFDADDTREAWIRIEPHVSVYQSEADCVCFAAEAKREERRVVILRSQGLEEEWWVKTSGPGGSCPIAQTCSPEWFEGMQRRTMSKLHTSDTC